MIQRVFVDMDGVLVDFIAGALRSHGLEGLQWPPGEISVYRATGLAPEAFWNFDRAWWGDLDWCDDGREILDLLYNRFGRDPVCVLSSPHQGDSMAGKFEWLERNLPDTIRERRFLIGQGKRFCAWPGALLLDDDDFRVAQFREAGGRALLVPRVWNSGHSILQRQTTVDYLTQQIDLLRKS